MFKMAELSDVDAVQVGMRGANLYTTLGAAIGLHLPSPERYRPVADAA